MEPKLAVEILTLFPRMCEGYLAESILGKAREAGLVEVRVSDVREFAPGSTAWRTTRRTAAGRAW